MLSSKSCLLAREVAMTKLIFVYLSLKIKLMEALSRIPRILETLEEMRSTHTLEEVFTNYKKNVKYFIESMKNEVIALINQY